MKRIATLITLIIASITLCSAQKIEGSWMGVLTVQGTMKLRLVFNISKTGNSYTTLMDSPDQQAKGMPTQSTKIENDSLKIAIPAIGGSFAGKMQGDSIYGVFTQHGAKFPLTLKPHKGEIKINRPQEPKPPFPYRVEAVQFSNPEAGITLAGTLTMPSAGSNFAAVVLITGSGPQNRDEEIMGHKTFLVLADYLTRHGVAVLRYDDRGVAGSEGEFARATTHDFASDAKSAVDYLKGRKEINSKRIGLIGHSEGGIVAPIVASTDKSIDFIVLMAGVGVDVKELMLRQKKDIELAMGYSQEDVEKAQKLIAPAYDILEDRSITPISAVGDSVYSYFEKAIGGSKEQLQDLTRQMISPWLIELMGINPREYLSQVECAVLAVNGSKDLQVAPCENLSAIETTLKKAGNKNVTIVEFEGLNHLFQSCNTGLMSEYQEIEETISPVVLETIASWINKQTTLN